MEPQKLHGEYQEAYQNMALYLDTFTLTYVKKKEILEDIFGICFENQNRNIPILDVFNHGYQAFCDELITSLQPRSKREFYYQLAFEISLTILIFIILYLLMAYFLPSTRHFMQGSTLGMELRYLLLPLLAFPFAYVYVLCKNRQVFKASSTHRTMKTSLAGLLTYFLYSLIPLGLNIVTVPLSLVYVVLLILVIVMGFFYKQSKA